MPHSRRDFLIRSAASAALIGKVCMQPIRVQAAPLDLPIGIQLYTLGEAAEKDLEGTLRKLAGIGYREVELPPGSYGLSAAELKRMLHAANVRCRSAHFWPMPQAPGMASLESNLDQQIAFARELGLEYMVCVMPWLSKSLRDKSDTADGGFGNMAVEDWRQHANFLNEVGARVSKAGLRLAYHNHNVEFARYDGIVAFDEVLRIARPALVDFELDCGWVAAAGYDPTEYLKRFSGRFKLLHVKDITAAQQPTTRLTMKSTEVGHGVIDWRSVFAAAKAGGLRYYYVEQEPPFVRPRVESARMSYEFLHALDV